jgi:hypothetical protein
LLGGRKGAHDGVGVGVLGHLQGRPLVEVVSNGDVSTSLDQKLCNLCVPGRVDVKKEKTKKKLGLP